MKKCLLIIVFGVFASLTYAQVGIGTENPKATLDVTAVNSSGNITTAEGILIPRVDRERAQSMDVVEKSTMIYVNSVLTGTQTGKAINIDTEGFYYFNGTNWVKLASATSASSQFFYMPSIVINTSVTATGLKRNLHAEYVAQFTGKTFVLDNDGGTVDGNTPSTKFIKSDGAPVAIPNVPSATDLYYYITDYDTTSLANLSIDANGVLTYDVIGTGTDYSFVNIVFVVK
ncbi:hypothetical protein OBJ95_08315 [Empedobacter falsenii]